MPAREPESQLRAAEVTANDRRLLAAWIGVFEKSAWSTGPSEICSTLMNISDIRDDNPEALTPELAADLRQALKGSAMLRDEEIMREVRELSRLYPSVHWWWRPEGL